MSDIYAWAQNTLPPDELVEFRQADEINKQLWKSYVDTGKVLITEVTEDVFVPSLGQTVNTVVNRIITIADGVDPASIMVYPGYQYWVDRWPDKK